jgi:hypothetical protein
MANPLHKAEDQLVQQLNKKLMFADTVRMPQLSQRIMRSVSMVGDYRLIELDDGSRAIIFGITNEKCRLVIGDAMYIAIGATLAFYGEHWQHRHLIPRLLAFAK